MGRGAGRATATPTSLRSLVNLAVEDAVHAGHGAEPMAEAPDLGTLMKGIEARVAALESEALPPVDEPLPMAVASGRRIHRVASGTHTCCGWLWATYGGMPLHSDEDIATSGLPLCGNCLHA